jgi:hypothetical protein
MDPKPDLLEPVYLIGFFKFLTGILDMLSKEYDLSLFTFTKCFIKESLLKTILFIIDNSFYYKITLFSNTHFSDWMNCKILYSL